MGIIDNMDKAVQNGGTYYTNLTVLAISLVILLVIGSLAVCRMRQNTKGVKREITICFILSTMLAVVTTAFSAMSMYGFDELDPFLVVVPVLSLCGFYISLLATLVLRLHVTFGASAYRMSGTLVRVFVVVFILLFITTMAGSMGLVLEHYGYASGQVIFLFAGIAFLILYTFGSVLSVRFFAVTLSKLAESRATSMRDLNLSADDITLDKSQQNMIKAGSKYVLHCIASTVSVFLLFLIPQITAFGGILFPIDLCVNLSCLFFQFSFAADHYYMCCGCLDVRFSSFVSARTKRRIHRNSLSGPQPPKSGHSDGVSRVTSNSAIDAKEMSV